MVITSLVLKQTVYIENVTYALRRLFLCMASISPLIHVNELMQIWVLKSKVQECQKCGLKCHKKCIEYCMKQVPCYQKTFEDLQQSSEGEFAIYEHEKQGEEVGGGNGHRLLDQHRGGCKSFYYHLV